MWRVLHGVPQEFRSLLAEPVSLSLSTMRQQYENARNATQDNFAKSHAALSSECSAHHRAQQKLEGRTRDFIAVFSAVNVVAAAKLNPISMTAEQAATLLHQYSGILSDRRVESKLRHVCDEMRELQSRVAESKASLKDRVDTYIQVRCLCVWLVWTVVPLLSLSEDAGGMTQILSARSYRTLKCSCRCT